MKLSSVRLATIFIIVVSIFEFSAGLVYARTPTIHVMLLNRSMRNLEYALYDEFDLCQKKKLYPKQREKLVLGGDEGKTVCKSQSYYRFSMKAFKKSEQRFLTDDCMVIPDFSDQDLIVMWDGVKCWVKQNDRF